MTSELLGRLPEYGFLPPGSSLPYEGDKNFTGRQLEMRALAQVLTPANFVSDSTLQALGNQTQASGKQTAVSYRGVVICGSSGSGKTLMAVEFCYRYGHFFRGIHWLKASKNTARQNWSWEVTAIGISSGLRPYQADLDEKAQVILNFWAKNAPHLVVLDDVGDTGQIPQLLKSFINVRLLITTQDKDWEKSSDFFILPMNPLAASESLFLLRRFSPRLETLADNLVTPLTTYFGNLPLSLYLAAHFLNIFNQVNPLDYMVLLDDLQAHLSPTMAATWLKQHPFQQANRLLLCIAYSWQQLDVEQDSLARLVLTTCCYFAPDQPIPIDLIKQALPDKKITTEALEQAIKVLSLLGVLIPVPNGVVIRGPVAKFGQVADEINTNGILPDLVGRLTEFMFQLNEKRECEQLYIVRRHLETAATAQDKTSAARGLALTAQKKTTKLSASPIFEEQAEKNISGLWNELGFGLNHLSDYKGAKACYERALQIDIKAFGRPHPIIARDLNNLGSVFRSCSDWVGAKKYYQQALQILEKTHDLANPEAQWVSASTAINNLGGIWQAQGDLAQAKRYYERALRIDEAAYGPDHPFVASDIRNLAGIALARGDLLQAKDYYEWALWIDETALGSDHPKVATGVSSLANVLKAQGEWADAQAAYERAFQIAENVHGQENPKLIPFIRSLAEIHHECKNLEQARAYYERLLQVEKAAYGTEQAEDVSALALILRELNDLAGAKRYYEQALQISESVLDVAHPDLARAALLLGAVLHNTGNLTEASVHQKRALALLEKVYGNEHLAVAEAACSYGDTLYGLGELSEARLCYEHAYTVFEIRLGSEDPKTTSTLAMLNEIIEAEKNFNEISVTQLEMTEQTLGQVTLENAVSANNRGNLLRTKGDLVSAREAYKQALHIWRILLGAEHPNVASAYTNLGIIMRTQGNLEGARICFERALQINEKAFGPFHPRVAIQANNLAGILEVHGDLQGARANLERALRIDEVTYGVDHPNVAARLNALGQIQNVMGDQGAAQKSHRQALLILERQLPADHPEIQKTLGWIRS